MPATEILEMPYLLDVQSIPISGLDTGLRRSS